MDLWLIAVAWTFVGVLAPAAMHKVKDHVRFRAMLGAYQVVPEWGLKHAAIGVAFAEVATIALLIFLPIIGLMAATLLFALYLCGIGVNILRKRSFIDCGCGDEPVPLSWRIVLRNLCLIAVGLVCVLVGPGGVSMSEFILALPMAAVAIVLYHGFEQLILNAANRSKLFGVA